MYTVVLLRHGQSIWNEQNIFTGWTDVKLSNQGIDEAIKAGNVLKEHEFSFDIDYTSSLKRSINTLEYIIDILNQKKIETYSSWQLNERHYGALQGMNKDDAIKYYGNNQVSLWKRDLNATPPLIDGKGENLLDTMKRVVEYWNRFIVPNILNNKRIIIVAHGNSIRALVSYLNDLSNEQITNLEIPTGNPLVFELDENLQPIRNYYLK